MSLFIRRMRLFSYDAKDKSKNWETKIEMREKLFLQKVELQFSPAESVASNQGVLEANVLKNISRKNYLWSTGTGAP